MEHEHVESYISSMILQSDESYKQGDGRFFCGVCQKGSRQRQDIERHVESNHIETHPYVCPICGSQHKTRRYLKLHQKIHI